MLIQNWWWWILTVTLYTYEGVINNSYNIMFCACRTPFIHECLHKLRAVFAVPAVRPQNNEDNEGQSTPWKNDNEMQRAARLQYPVFLQPDQSIPEINVSISLGSGRLRKARQTGLQGPATSSKLANSCTIKDRCTKLLQS